MPSSLTKIYNTVVSFEKRVRAALGADIAAHVSPKRAEDITSRMIDLIGDTSSDARLKHIGLIDEVLAEAAKTYPVLELAILWPNKALSVQEIAILKDNGFNTIASIAEIAQKRSTSGPLPPRKL